MCYYALENMCAKFHELLFVKYNPRFIGAACTHTYSYIAPGLHIDIVEKHSIRYGYWHCNLSST